MMEKDTTATKSTMQIIIPMTGLGSRFVSAGYAKIKPLISLHSHPIIEWVAKMFPGERDIVFICRDEHLQSTDLAETLIRICPTGKIISISGHKKGPVYSILQGSDAIDSKRPVFCSYCDYYMHYDYPLLTRTLLQKNYDGAIPCYTGFHPHLIPPQNVYASCKIHKNNTLIEIKEKHSFHKDNMQNLYSPGLYYFKNGEILKKYFQKHLEEGPSVQGEYYISLVYNAMVQDGLSVYVPPCISHFCQWGTPHDLEEYLFWIQLVKKWKHQ